MIPALIVVFGSLLPMILLNIVYALQNKKDVITSKTFTMLCLINLTAIILELVDPYLFYKGYNTIATISLKFQWSTGVLFSYFIYIYINVLINNVSNYKNMRELLKKDKSSVVVTVIVILYIIMLMILPFRDNVAEANNFFPFPHAFLSIGFAAILISILVVQVIKAKTLSVEAKKLIAASVILAIIYVILQLLLKDIALAQVLLYFILFMIYIIVENPDKYMLEEMNQAKRDYVKVNTVNKIIIENIKDNGVRKAKELNEILSKYKDGIKDNNYKEDFENIYFKLKSINYTIENGLSLITNKEDSDQNEFEIIDIINKVYLLTNKQVDSKVKYEFKILNKTPKKIKSNYSALLFVLLNCFNRARKDTEIGKIIINIGTSNFDGNSYITIKCRDTGNGMSEKNYNQLKQSIANDDYSNNVDGDIVSISKRLELIGGRLAIDSNLDVGTTLVCYIPYTKVNDEVYEDTIIRDVNATVNKINSYAGKKLLLVDRNENMINQLLDLYNIDVDITDNLEDAINKVKQEINYSWIFVNISDSECLKVIDILKDLVEKFDYKLPKLVALMPFRSSQYMDIINKNNFDSYLIQPIEIEYLNDILSKGE